MATITELLEQILEVQRALYRDRDNEELRRRHRQIHDELQRRGYDQGPYLGVRYEAL